MSHKTRAEQRAFKVRKDPHKLARPTRVHVSDACQACQDAIIEGLVEYYNTEETENGTSEESE